jgi:hypothetical protein
VYRWGAEGPQDPASFAPGNSPGMTWRHVNGYDRNVPPAQWPLQKVLLCIWAVTAQRVDPDAPSWESSSWSSEQWA